MGEPEGCEQVKTTGVMSMYNAVVGASIAEFGLVKMKDIIETLD